MSKTVLWIAGAAMLFTLAAAPASQAQVSPAVSPLPTAIDQLTRRQADSLPSIVVAPSQASPETFGPISQVIVTKFGAGGFRAFLGTDALSGSGTLSCPMAFCGWLGGVDLPSGALILGIDLTACDGDATGHMEFALFAFPRVSGGVLAITPFTSTGLAQTPGCGVFSFNLPTPQTVDNFGFAYVVDVLGTPGSNTNLNWNQVRIRYRLQVSPAPGVATFADVPVGHPQRPFVEALVAAGITGGCGGGNFCPDAPLTRGQMAVFLAAALGLHFPN